MLDDEARVMLMAVTKMAWPGGKFRVFLFVYANQAASENGVECSQRVITEWTGISANVVRQYLKQLVDEKILERYDGGGPRGHAFRVVAEFALWRSRWFGSRPGVDHDWHLKQSAAVAELEVLFLTLEMRKNATVARPDRPLGLTVARSGRATSGTKPRTVARSGRATSRSLVDGLGRATGVDDDAADTISSNSETLLLTEGASQSANRLLAAIRDRGGAHAFGKLAKQVCQLVGDDDAADLVAAVNSAPTGLAVKAYIEIVAQTIARRSFTKPVERTPEPQQPEDLGPRTDPPWVKAGFKSWRVWIAAGSPEPGAGTCETDDGGDA